MFDWGTSSCLSGDGLSALGAAEARMAWVGMARELYMCGEYDSMEVFGGIICELKAVMCIIGLCSHNS